MGSRREHGMVGDDPVVTLGGVVGAVGKTGSTECGNFSVENLDVRWIGGCSARTCTKGTRIDGFLLFRIVDHSFGPNAEECSEVSFIRVDHT